MGGGGRGRVRELCNPYYMRLRAGELFKKLFIVFFLKESSGNGMNVTGPFLSQIMRFQLENWRIMISILKDV